MHRPCIQEAITVTIVWNYKEGWVMNEKKEENLTVCGGRHDAGSSPTAETF